MLACEGYNLWLIASDWGSEGSGSNLTLTNNMTLGNFVLIGPQFLILSTGVMLVLTGMCIIQDAFGCEQQKAQARMKEMHRLVHLGRAEGGFLSGVVSFAHNVTRPPFHCSAILLLCLPETSHGCDGSRPHTLTSHHLST